MAVIKSSKIFISIRHPHATCIINAQPKDTTTTFTARTFPSADLLDTPPMRVCRGERMSSTPRGGQGSARLHPGTSLRRLRSRCVAPLSLGALLVGKRHPEVLVSQPPLRADVQPPHSLPAGTLAALRVSCRRAAKEPQSETPDLKVSLESCAPARHVHLLRMGVSISSRLS